MAVVVALFIIGALVIVLDNLVYYAYRRFTKFFPIKQVPPKPLRPAPTRNLFDL
jgi:hypothetical protein